MSSFPVQRLEQLLVALCPFLQEIVMRRGACQRCELSSERLKSLLMSVMPGLCGSSSQDYTTDECMQFAYIYIVYHAFCQQMGDQVGDLAALWAALPEILTELMPAHYAIDHQVEVR